MTRLLLFSWCALALAACSADAPAADPMPAHRTVEAAQVERVDAPLPIRASGTLAQASEQTLSFKVGGIVARMSADVGDAVRAGQVLATLDLTEIDAQVQAARSASEKADRDLARAQRLLADSVATPTQVRDARTQSEVAASSLRAAEFNRAFAVVRAPESGRVLARMAEPNELVAPGQPVFRVGTQSGGWVVRVALADRDVVRVRVGDAARVALGAFAGESFGGRVMQVAYAASGPGGTFEVEIAIADPDGRLRSGFVATVEIAPQGDGHALVPASALVSGDGDRGVVFAVDESGVVRERSVRVLTFTGDHLAIADGLQGVARVVTTGAPFLTSGDTVTVAAAPLAVR